MKQIFFVTIVMLILSNSCKKPKGDEYCIWASETTALNCLINCNKYDSCKYDSIQMTLKFNTRYIGEWPPCGTYNDSVTGNIEYLNIITNYLISNDTLRDTINDIVKFKINYYNNEVLEKNINFINSSHLRCHSFIYLFLNAPTDTNCLQFFTIDYKEADGTIYTDSTQVIYLEP